MRIMMIQISNKRENFLRADYVNDYNWKVEIKDWVLCILRYFIYSVFKTTYCAFQVVLENLYHDEVWYHVGTGYAAGPVFVVTAVIGHLTSLRNTKTL